MLSKNKCNVYINSHTYYSLRYGTVKPEDLLAIASSYGVKTVAITDINNTSGCLSFVRLAAKYNIKPILGVDFRNGVQQQFIALAKNNNGFHQINRYLSLFLHDKTLQIPEFIDKYELLSHCFIIYPYHPEKKYTLKANEFVGVKPKQLNRLKYLKSTVAKNKLVILNTASFKNKKDYNTHRLLRAIDNNVLLSKLPKTEQGCEEALFRSASDIEKIYYDFPQLLTNTQSLLAQCSIDFNFSEAKKPANKQFFTTSAATDYKLLEKLAYTGVTYRYGTLNKTIDSRIKKELNLVKEKNFVSYFLINWDILKYARSKNYFYVGRGSGANSIIAYLLRITDVDPIELDLYFERFINLYRSNPPDFDLDFSWRDRDDIINYIFNTYKNTALIAVYNTFKFKASVRELGKVFGLPKAEMDVLTRGKYHSNQLDKLSRLVLVYSEYIQGFPNYLGIHAGGIIISEKPIHHYTATFLPPKGYATTQFDMVVAEDIGLYKFDILSQRGLGKIKEAVEIVKYNHPNLPDVDIHDIKRFKQDERIKNLLRNAKAIGCFYVESPAMRMLLKKLSVDDYLGLVAASSVIRPGVSNSGMMQQYIIRHRIPERRKDAHPVLLEIMPDTYGVMVYQEDVIKVAHYFGGLDFGQADVLRRGMSGKYRSRAAFLKVKQSFFDNCKSSGKPDETVKDIWRQIESFAGYAFAKGHSASYAVESYQSLFLKAYFPLEYMVATINNFGGFYTTELYVHDARMQGAIIEAPCINKSHAEAIICGKTIYLGFMFLHALEQNTIIKIVNERSLNGNYKSLDHFIERVPISIEQIAILIKINAFRFTNKNKRELLWEAHLKTSKKVTENPEPQLFKTERISCKTPELTTTRLENAFDELELLGFPLCNPFALLSEKTKSRLQAKHLVQFEGKLVNIQGYLVIRKPTKTANGKPMFFGTFLDQSGDFIDTVHFPPVAKKYPLRGYGIYDITGKVSNHFDCISIEVTKLERLATIADPRYSEAKRTYKDLIPKL